MYGTFTTFRYPAITYASTAPLNSTAYNGTRMFTSNNLSTSFELGMGASFTDQGALVYQPYFWDYGPTSRYNPIGDVLFKPDDRLHSFMGMPHCTGCTTWDVFYDFNMIGTTQAGDTPTAHHVSTGWTLDGELANVSFPQTQNRIQYLDGNNTFQRFSIKDLTIRAPEGNCSPGADPKYCFRFTTGANVSPARTVISWDVSKDVVTPPRLSPRTAPTTTTTGAPSPVATRGYFNGVDQAQLSQCMHTAPDQCLTTVPGLSRCLQQRKACNSDGLDALHAREPVTRTAPMTVDQA
ncbi:hypothetical protein [Kutzneria albida]|uniref:Uncharacterized protein n=2 Tax=Kutzneria TaxID=43356 RepID=W5WC90_9PSEU|nr:hypothetical protein [Kutzneria albida]AHH98778.1 hypothetical protein KALB_5416 [Kutzneria albida DSM 43870]